MDQLSKGQHQKAGQIGRSLVAERHAVDEFLNGGNWSLVKEFVGVETGKRNDRPQLAAALKACRAYGAKLVIAKLAYEPEGYWRWPCRKRYCDRAWQKCTDRNAGRARA